MRKEVYKTVLPGGGIYTRITTYIGVHGGKRDGAGRKSLSETNKRVNFSMTVCPETKHHLQEEARQRGLGIGQLIDELVGIVN